MDPLIVILINISSDIFNSLGPGYNEVIYHKAFEVALRLQRLDYQSEVIVPVFYKGNNIGHGRIDLLINNQLIIELKAVSTINNDSTIIQIKNYMKHYSIMSGLIINFGQSNKINSGELSIKYISGNKIYNFVNNIFVEQISLSIGTSTSTSTMSI